MRANYIPLMIGVALFSGCDPAQDVQVLPLPSLEQPSAEARFGLPEVAGVWHFAGWEILRGDSASLERTFPSFGELRLDTQRLDSIAGSFVAAGGIRGVVGEVRKDGNVAMVTYGGGAATGFIAGRLAQDTLWLELTSILPPDEWPREARAAFVREPVAETIAWVRGARPADRAPAFPTDSLAVPADTSEGASVPPPLVPGPVPQPSEGNQSGLPAAPRPATPVPGGVRQPAQPQPARPQPAQPQPAQPQPSQPQPAQPQPVQPQPAQPQPAQPQPVLPQPVLPQPALDPLPLPSVAPSPVPGTPPSAEPTPTPAPPPAEPDDMPPLLGEPVTR